MGEALSGLDHGGGSEAPSDAVLLSQLIELLFGRPKQCLLLSDLAALLPGSLRKRAKEQGGLGQWIQKHGSLFRIDRQPGKETVILAMQTKGSHPGDDVVDSALAHAGFSPVLDVSQQDASAAPNEQTKTLARAACEEVVIFDEEGDGHLAVQLRGLPYKTTVEDVKVFLGEHMSNLSDIHPIRLILNRDGRPSGFARVVFTSADAARACRDDLHCRSMDDRYIEIFLYTERPSRLGRKAAEWAPRPVDGTTRIKKEQVVGECRIMIHASGNNHMLLSLLGVMLSEGSRAYLKETDQGLKHFLEQFPGEFAFDGPRGCEYVTFSPMQIREDFNNGPVAIGLQQASASTRPASAGLQEEKQPTSLKLWNSAAPQDGMASAGCGLVAPSDWATPAPGAGPWGNMHSQASAPWSVVPWPSAGAGAANAESGSRGSGRDEHDSGASWSLMQLSSSQMLWPGSARGNGSSLSSWSDLANVTDSALSLASTGLAAIMLRGLPYKCTEQDILAFFAQHDVIDRVSDVPNAVNFPRSKTGRLRSKGQAVVNMHDRTDAELAQRVLNGQWMGNRYIEVFLHGDEICECVGGCRGCSHCRTAATAAVTAAANAPGSAQPVACDGQSGAGSDAACAKTLSLAGNLMQGQAAAQGEATGPAAGDALPAGRQEFMAQYASMQAVAWQQQQQNLWQAVAGGSSMMFGFGAADACGLGMQCN
eukprot:TRINITY_DN1091_c0_g1_i2.p1 TRINITY_DN1091_c0_g1~~TRINITY_DN1091_c0_g1_i2.p1  ORF type:complete len:707 (+),score=150.75 TRINITY_DN1091_c0_g1_i2:100-2220(+)